MWSGHTTLIASHMLILLVVHILTTLILISWSSVFSVLVTTRSSLVMSTTTSSFVLVNSLLMELIDLHDLNQLLKNLSHVGMGDKIIQMESTGLLSHVLL